MNWTDWESVKENLQKIYGKTSQFFLFFNLLLYVWGCAIAGGPISPLRYVGFVYHCCQWGAKGGF